MSWRPIPGFEALYEIALDGRVRSLDRTVPQRGRYGTTQYNHHHGRVLRPYRCKNGRLRVILHDHAHRRHARYVDQLVEVVFGEAQAA